MAHAIESILPGGEDVEIIIVNDGSKDDTLKIAREYEGKYPDIVRVVDKENGGHGDAVTAGLTHASGSYFKVVDSDDWVDEESLPLKSWLCCAGSRMREKRSICWFLTMYMKRWEWSTKNVSTTGMCSRRMRFFTGRISDISVSISIY